MLDLAMLAALHDAHRDAVSLPVADFALGEHRFDFEKHAYLMGVVNLSADSWYRESVVLNADAAIARGKVLHAQGAAIVDVGAESSLAHAARIDGSTQSSALVPVVRDLAAAGFAFPSKRIIQRDDRMPESGREGVEPDRHFRMR